MRILPPRVLLRAALLVTVITTAVAVACTDSVTTGPPSQALAARSMRSAVYVAQGDKLVLMSGDRYAVAGDGKTQASFTRTEHITDAVALQGLRDYVISHGPSGVSASVIGTSGEPRSVRRYAKQLPARTINGHVEQVSVLLSDDGRTPAGLLLMRDGRPLMIADLTVERPRGKARVKHMRMTSFDSTGHRQLVQDHDFGSDDVASAGNGRQFFAGLRRLVTPDVLYADEIDDYMEEQCRSLKDYMTEALNLSGDAALAITTANAAVSAAKDAVSAALRALSASSTEATAAALADAEVALSTAEGLAAAAVVYAAWKAFQLGEATGRWFDCMANRPRSLPESPVGGGTGTTPTGGKDNQISSWNGGPAGRICYYWITQDYTGRITETYNPNGCILLENLGK